MTRPETRRATRNTGAFLGPDMLAPVPMRTLSDDYRDDPTEPEEDRDPEPGPEPEPEPEPPSPVRRLVERLLGRPRSGR